jgi:hypothetical protein
LALGAAQSPVLDAAREWLTAVGGPTVALTKLLNEAGGSGFGAGLPRGSTSGKRFTNDQAVYGGVGGFSSIRVGDAKVRRCRLTPDWPKLDRAWIQRVKLKYDESLSSFAYNFNMRRYTKAAADAAAAAAADAAQGFAPDLEVGCT